MVRSTSAEMSALRKLVFVRDGSRCRWPGCGTTDDLEMAHLVHRGMGGSREQNTVDNCLVLCSFHHDMFDGRITLKRWELARLLARAVGIG